MSELLEPAREKLRQVARELAWLPERAAAITRELTAIEVRLVEAGEGAQDDLATLGAMRRALHHVIADHVEPALGALEAIAGEVPEEAG